MLIGSILTHCLWMWLHRSNSFFVGSDSHCDSQNGLFVLLPNQTPSTAQNEEESEADTTFLKSIHTIIKSEPLLNNMLFNEEISLHPSYH